MLDLPQIITDNPNYLSEFVKYQENTLKGTKEEKEALERSSSDYLFSNGHYFSEDDLDVILERTESRIRGAKKMAFDLQKNPTKASPFKIYLLSSLADKEHAYRIDTDADSYGLEIKSYLNKIKHLIEENSPAPDDASWNTIRKNYPALMHDIVENVEKAKNKTNFLLDMSLGENSKKYWTQCRIYELYDTIKFKDDLDPNSEPSSPNVELHPTDTFLKYKVEPSEFQEKKRHRFVLLEEMSEIRKEARLYADFFNAKLALKKTQKQKPS